MISELNETSKLEIFFIRMKIIQNYRYSLILTDIR